MTRTRKSVGRISFVGAGPGDPSLLTRRAYAALTTADQVVYDRDVPIALLDAVRADAVPDAQFSPAEGTPGDVAKVLLSAARSGLRAVRLVDGDPFAADAGGQGGAGGRAHRGAVRGGARASGTPPASRPTPGCRCPAYG